MTARTQPPALDTDCAVCGRPLTDTKDMIERGPDVYVHRSPCEGWRLGPTVNTPLVLVAGLIGFFGGVLFLEALGQLRNVAVVVAFVLLLVLAWPVSRRES